MEQMNLATVMPLPYVTKLDMAEAHAAALREADLFADWLYGECEGKTASAWPLMVEATAEDFKRIPTHALIGLSHDCAQPAKVRTAALDAVTERFLADDNTQARIIELANQIAIDRAEGEEQDAEEERQHFARVMDMPALAMRRAA